MTLAALAAGILVFIGTLRILRAEKVAAEIIGTTQNAIAVMNSPDLGDDAKEAEVRRASLKLFRGFAVILAISAVALALPALILWAGAALGLYPLGKAVDTAANWPFILVSSVGSVALWLALDRLRRPVEAAGNEAAEVPYSPLDQALHDYAFASPARQRRLARIEDRLFAPRIRATHAERPVFVTSLPRAGTTIMLELLADLPEMAAQTYSHMPFTLSPLLWGGFSKIFRKAGARSERAHGDGIEVDIDSPEAFEEMIWMAFWPRHYAGRTIRPWTTNDRDPAFEAFLARHMTKVVAGKGAPARRYLSKNNANIARLPLLSTLFPDASVVIPVRDPWAQVASLQRQHRRFADLHAREPFARRYMEGIGHLEFGAALKPIGFEGFDPEAAPADGAEFWLAYWVAAYEAVLRTAAPDTIFVDHDALSADPHTHLPPLAERLRLSQPETLAAMAPRLKPLRSVAPPEAPEPLLRRARELNTELRARARHTIA